MKLGTTLGAQDKMLGYSLSILLWESGSNDLGTWCRTWNLDFSSLGVKLSSLLGSSLYTKFGENLSAELCLSLVLCFVSLLRNSLGCPLSESDCESLTWHKNLVWNLVWNLVLMVKCLAIHFELHFVTLIAKHLLHGTDLGIWIGHQLVVSSALCLEVHLILTLLDILVLSLESLFVYRLVLCLVFCWGVRLVAH